MKLTSVVVAAALVLPARAFAYDAPKSDFAFQVLRDGNPIGTSTIDVRSDAQGTNVEIATHIAVKFAFVVVYRFDQTEKEFWSPDGRLLALDATTDDNGSRHNMRADNTGIALKIETDGTSRSVPPQTVPMSLWNASLLAQRSALSTRDGAIVPVKVYDKGTETVAVRGSPVRAHHYVVTTTFPEDVWYDSDNHLVQMELKGRDGSVVRYQRV